MVGDDLGRAALIHGTDWLWLWYPAGAAVTIPLAMVAARMRYRRGVRMHFHVAEIEVVDRREDGDPND